MRKPADEYAAEAAKTRALAEDQLQKRIAAVQGGRSVHSDLPLHRRPVSLRLLALAVAVGTVIAVLLA